MIFGINFNFFKRSSKNEVIAVFITNSKSCPCFYLHTLAEDANNNLLISLKKTDNEEKIKISESKKKNKKYFTLCTWR